MKVYVLTEGMYSGYEVCGVTLDWDYAVRWLNEKFSKDPYSSACIEEYDTDDKIAPRPKENKLFCVFRKNSTGKFEAKTAWYLTWRINDVKSNSTVRYVFVYAKDKSHALKIGQDLIAEYMAREEGIT